MRVRIRRIVGAGMMWAALWFAFWLVVFAGIGVADPDSIDPGDGVGMALIFGPMGLLSGVIFAALLSAGRQPEAARSLVRVVACGLLGSVLAQVPYLGHGDQGLAANLGMALIATGIGGIVTLAWFGMARWRSPAPSLQPPASSL